MNDIRSYIYNAIQGATGATEIVFYMKAGLLLFGAYFVYRIWNDSNRNSILRDIKYCQEYTIDVMKELRTELKILNNKK